MKKLILHPTDTSQWHALVNEAQASASLVLPENTESYLVFLLMRFTEATQLLESIMALDFLESLNLPAHRQTEKLREVGDKSLLFCGLFPGMAEKRRVSINYYSNLGQAAYLTLSELSDHEAELFYQLSEQFLSLQKILQSMRTTVEQYADINSTMVSSLNRTMN